MYNVSSTFTYLRGPHSIGFGGTFRRTTMYESIGGAPYQVNLGVAAGDPVSGIFTTTMPGVRSEDLGNVRTLYALLTGRISSATGQNALDENTKQYGSIRRSVERRRTSAACSRRISGASARLTLNYGLRWEFSGAATNPNEVYSSPTPADLLGPFSAPFQPGTLNGVRSAGHPAAEAVQGRPREPRAERRHDVESRKTEGCARHHSRKGVFRASFGVNYYDEGLIDFQTAAGNGPA